MPSAPPTVDTEVAARLRLAVMRLARRMRQNADTGATPSQLSALSTLDRRGPMPLRELAGLEEIGPSTLTRIVAALEDAGLVSRTGDPTDRRVSLVGVTAKGRRLLKGARTRSNTYLAERMNTLADDELATLVGAVTVLERLLGDEA